MTRLAILALLALAGCDKLQASDSEWQHAQADAERMIEIERLRGELGTLKADVERDREYLSAVSNSLTEARSNHAALLKTFNENVDKGNARDKWQDDRLNWAEAQHGVIR